MSFPVVLGLKEELASGVHLELAYIPSGTFWMGSPDDEVEREAREHPQHEVAIAPFYLGKSPVTQAQWLAVSQLDKIDKPLEAEPSWFKGENRPVETVNWDDAIEFCKRLSNYAGKPYRLPSEAEWEYACRAGTPTPFYFGNTLSTEQANYDGNATYNNSSVGRYRERTSEVGLYPANGFGIYDLHGNVWEWCLDHWHPNYKGAPADGSAWVYGGDVSRRMLRGGSWGSVPRDCRSACRYYAERDKRFLNTGFRVCCDAASV